MSRASRLQAVLRVAELREREASAFVAEQRHQLAAAETQLAVATGAASQHLDHAGDVNSFLSARGMAAARVRAVRTASDAVTAAEQHLTESLDGHVQARRQTRVYANLLDRMRDEQRRAREAGEQRLVDDLAALKGDR